MTEAHYILLAGELGAQPFCGVVGVADGQQVMHHGLVGTAVQCPFESGDGCGDWTLDVGLGGGHHACCKGGGVEAVFGARPTRWPKQLQLVPGGELADTPEAIPGRITSATAFVELKDRLSLGRLRLVSMPATAWPTAAPPGRPQAFA